MLRVEAHDRDLLAGGGGKEKGTLSYSLVVHGEDPTKAGSSRSQFTIDEDTGTLFLAGLIN